MKLNKKRLMEVAGIELKESSFTEVTKDMWSKMSEDEQADALLSAVKDPDEAQRFIGSKWEALPSQVTSNMYVYNGGLKEAKVNLDKGFSVRQLGGRNYSLQYSEYDWEPSMQELEKYAATLQKLISKHANDLDVSRKDNESAVYVADGDVAIGISFSSSMKFDDIAKIVNNTSFRN